MEFGRPGEAGCTRISFRRLTSCRLRGCEIVVRLFLAKQPARSSRYRDAPIICYSDRPEIPELFRLGRVDPAAEPWLLCVPVSVRSRSGPTVVARSVGPHRIPVWPDSNLPEVEFRVATVSRLSCLILRRSGQSHEQLPIWCSQCERSVSTTRATRPRMYSPAPRLRSNPKSSVKFFSFRVLNCHRLTLKLLPVSRLRRESWRSLVTRSRRVLHRSLSIR